MEPLTTKRRQPQYLSPSALNTFLKDKDDYYIKYIAPVKIPREPQTKAMAAGSAFDAYAKSFLHGCLFGNQHKESNKYSLDALLEAQVESHNRDWARGVGKYLFDNYCVLGCLADLMSHLTKAASEPRFEFDVRGAIDVPGDGKTREGFTRITGGVPLLGKPDVFFLNAEGQYVIRDFKVNGYCSRSAPSPMPGYLRLRPGGALHKDCFPTQYHGMTIDGAAFLETRNSDWADQLATYGWLLGASVGTEIVVGIDQIVCKGGSVDGSAFPEIRVAEHWTRVGEKHQYDLINRYHDLWGRLISEPFYFFTDLPFDDSVKHCKMLNDRAALLYSGLDEDEQWLAGTNQKRAW